MQVVVCNECGTKNRIDQDKLASSEAKCGRCGGKLEAGSTAAAGQESTPVFITDQTFEQEAVLERGRPVLVDCWAPWCGPCRRIGPIMDQLAAESQGRYKIGKLNVDENPQTAARFQIASIPTMLIFKDGQLVDRLTGLQSKQVIEERLRLASRFAA